MGPKNSEVNFCSFLYLQKQNHQAIGSGFSQEQPQIKRGLLFTRMITFVSCKFGRVKAHYWILARKLSTMMKGIKASVALSRNYSCLLFNREWRLTPITSTSKNGEVKLCEPCLWFLANGTDFTASARSLSKKVKHEMSRPHHQNKGMREDQWIVLHILTWIIAKDKQGKVVVWFRPGGRATSSHP